MSPIATESAVAVRVGMRRSIDERHGIRWKGERKGAAIARPFKRKIWRAGRGCGSRAREEELGPLLATQPSWAEHPPPVCIF
jgi:hypothetical protein